MYRSDDRWSRAGAGLVSAGVQLALGALLVYGLAASGQQRRPAPSTLTTIDFTAPPPPEPPRPHPASPAPAAPAGRKAEPLPVEAPPVKVPLSPAPAATSAGAGNAATSGTGTQGSGPGADGAGTGSGSGGGGIASQAQRIAGALRDRDYPRDLEAQRVGGSVQIAFRVRTDGRVAGCTVVGSSGSAELDALTCRLFTERFRFRPALTAAGEPVESTLRTSFTWGTRGR
ncbi:MAG: energy transducer TonB [Tsuneonella sp.]